MKNSRPHRLLTALPLFLLAASSCGKKTPDPPVSCYRKDGGACQFARTEGGTGDLRGSDGLGTEVASGADGSYGPNDAQTVGRDSSLVEARSPSLDTASATGTGGLGGSGGAGGSGGSTGTGPQDASAVDAPAADAPAEHWASLDTAGPDSIADAREAGRDSTLDLPDGFSQDAYPDGADAPGPSPDTYVEGDGGIDAPMQDADENEDSHSDVVAGACPTVSAAHQYETDSVGGLAIDNSGNPYIAAKLAGSHNFGAGTVTSAGLSDLLIAKLDPNTLTAVWSKSFSGTGESSSPTDQIPYGLAVSHSGQVGVVGNFTGNMVVNSTTNLVGGGAYIDFIMATDGSGNGLWGHAVDAQQGGLKAIASHPARDEFVVCGFALGPVTALGLPGTYGDPGSDPAVEDIIIAKLNATNGTVIWSRQIGGTGSQGCSAVALDADGVVYAAGAYNGTLDFGTGPLPVLATGVQAIWVAKLDSTDGHGLLVKKYGTQGKQVVRGIAVDATGNVAITGLLRFKVPFGTTTLTSSGESDGYLAKLDANLDPIWATRWGDAKPQQSLSVAFASNGHLFVSGYLQGSFSIGNNVLTANGPTLTVTAAYWAEFSGSGESLCAAAYGNLFDQTASAMAVHGTEVLVAGTFNGTAAFSPSISLTSSTKSSFLFVLPSEERP